MQDILINTKEFISQPWPWYVGGVMIAVILFTLLFFGKEFGVSANFRILCAACGADKQCDFFDFDWKSQIWNLLFVAGAMIGGFLAAHYLSSADGNIAHVSDATIESLKQLGLTVENNTVPIVPGFYSWDALSTIQGILIIAGGGFLVGFGARYAGGCTSGHAISGLSALQVSSLIAVIGFFIGGLIMTYVFFPIIF